MVSDDGVGIRSREPPDHHLVDALAGGFARLATDPAASGAHVAELAGMAESIASDPLLAPQRELWMALLERELALEASVLAPGDLIAAPLEATYNAAYEAMPSFWHDVSEGKSPIRRPRLGPTR